MTPERIQQIRERITHASVQSSSIARLYVDDVGDLLRAYEPQRERADAAERRIAELEQERDALAKDAQQLENDREYNAGLCIELRQQLAVSEERLRLERIGRAGFLAQLRDELGASSAPSEERCIDNVREARQQLAHVQQATIKTGDETMMQRRSIVGWFDSANQQVPAVDPGLSVLCPVCNRELSDGQPLVTTSLMFLAVRARSYFYRAHKQCYEALTSAELSLLDGQIIDDEIKRLKEDREYEKEEIATESEATENAARCGRRLDMAGAGCVGTPQAAGQGVILQFVGSTAEHHAQRLAEAKAGDGPLSILQAVLLLRDAMSRPLTNMGRYPILPLRMNDIRRILAAWEDAGVLESKGYVTEGHEESERTAARQSSQALRDEIAKWRDPIAAVGEVRLTTYADRTIANLCADAIQAALSTSGEEARQSSQALRENQNLRAALLACIPVSERHGLWCNCDGPDDPALARHHDTCPTAIWRRIEAVLASREGQDEAARQPSQALREGLRDVHRHLEAIISAIQSESAQPDLLLDDAEAAFAEVTSLEAALSSPPRGTGMSREGQE